MSELEALSLEQPTSASSQRLNDQQQLDNRITDWEKQLLDQVDAEEVKDEKPTQIKKPKLLA